MKAPSMNARQPHAVLDLASRRLKGLKIERLLDLRSRRQPMTMLEIGTGSGGIAHYFGTHPDLRIQMHAVDVVDNRLIQYGYAFQQVVDTNLPYPANSFDVVLTNHVIEHVGDRGTQLAHLREIRRVLRDDGVGYLAVPNRWQLVEPHYKLAFLSWWPHRWRSGYLRRLRGVEFYDCEPLQLGQLERLFEETGLCHRNLCIEALRETLAIERPDSMVRKLVNMVPDRLIGSIRRIIPTLIYRFWR